MSLTDLPLSFWGYALETAAFTLNRAPSKSVETTPYELWFGKKPKLSFLKVWGCDAYVKKLQPDKLEPKSEKCVFIGYPKETVGYTFCQGDDTYGVTGIPSTVDGRGVVRRAGLAVSTRIVYPSSGREDA